MRLLRTARIAGLLFLLLGPATVLCRAAFAQIDPTGDWAPTFFEDQRERFAGAEMGDYLGMPLNAAGLFRAESWSAELVEIPENQCRAHGSDYGWRGPSALRIWKQVDSATQKTIAFHIRLSAYNAEQTIWMDGRPHPPPYARHTWQGFSTGHWEGDQLVIYTTHLKENWLGLNGTPRSDMATATEHLLRHGDVLTVAVITYDPVYLSEPLIRTIDFTYAPQQQMNPWPCESVDEVDRPAGQVPSYLMAQNPFIDEFAARYGIPPEATRGGPETMYPEYMKKLKTMKLLPRPKPPQQEQASPPTPQSSQPNK
jgi:hypothetical protein